MAVVAIDKDSLPFALSVKINEQPPKDRLPFALNRKLGTLDVALPPTTDQSPTPKPDLPKNPFKPLIGFDVACVVDNAVAIEFCQTISVNSDTVANCHTIKPLNGILLNKCQDLSISIFRHIANCQSSVFTDIVAVSHCQNIKIHHLSTLNRCEALRISPTVGFSFCRSVGSRAIELLHQCQHQAVQGVHNFDSSISYAKKSALISRCQTSKVLSVVGVPCRYYPIPEPPPLPTVSVCQIRPPSNRLPFALRRKSHQSQGFSAKALPFPLTCWHDLPPPQTPNKGTYIVKNTITATLGGIAFDPVSFSVRTDMNSYCWQGSVELSPTQYEKVKEKLDVERGNEPLITVDINGFLFSILAEEISRSRAFVNHSYNISGRSATAKLGADYAIAKSDVVKLDNYASQLINSQLADLPFSIGRFEIADWLIPADSYAISNKTPIAVINDVVSACGGFVWSDPNLPKLHLQKRWKVNAWELATANPDVILAVDVVKSISDQKRTNPRYNTVTLVGGHSGEVFREPQGRDRIAPIDSNNLYTDRDCVIHKGCQILSDSGTHGDYSLVMRWAEKYNIKLAELGQIWQINDPEGAFKGVVTSVAVDVKLENDVPTVWQTVGIDRYMDG